VVSDWYQSDDKVIKPMVDAAAKKYAADKKLTVRDCSKEDLMAAGDPIAELKVLIKALEERITKLEAAVKR
jgi:phosphoribosylaminoimidazole-succinocarboxamide synthase